VREACGVGIKEGIKLLRVLMKIPPGSDIGHVLAFVEGTEEAQEAR